MDRFAPAAFVTELEPQKPVHFFLHPHLSQDKWEIQNEFIELEQTFLA